MTDTTDNDEPAKNALDDKKPSDGPAANRPYGNPKLREISDDELQRILAEHKLWLETSTNEGKHADLSNINLSKRDLSGANLSVANLSGAKLNQANLSGANLSVANLRGAKLIRANLHSADLSEAGLDGASLYRANLSDARLFGAILDGASLSSANLSDAMLDNASLGTIEKNPAGGTSPDEKRNTRYASIRGAKLHGASLREVDLTEVSGLSADILAGTDLTGATLPEEIAAFSGLRYADELVGQARNLFRITLVGFLFSLSAVLSTTDAGLALNSVTALSVVQISLPIATLYWLAPAGLFAIYVYLYLYIDRMWLRIAAFPAIFSDGLSAEFHLRPWIHVGK